MYKLHIYTQYNIDHTIDAYFAKSFQEPHSK